MSSAVHAVPQDNQFPELDSAEPTERLFLNSLIFSSRKRALTAMKYVQSSDFGNTKNADAYDLLQELTKKPCYKVDGSDCFAAHNLYTEFREHGWFEDNLTKQRVIHLIGHDKHEDAQIAGCRLLEESLRTSLYDFHLNGVCWSVNSSLSQCLHHLETNSLIADKKHRLLALRKATNMPLDDCVA